MPGLSRGMAFRSVRLIGNCPMWVFFLLRGGISREAVVGPVLACFDDRAGDFFTLPAMLIDPYVALVCILHHKE